MTIFISIASYRDPQLLPTIQDCLAKARHPDDLRFGICWQHGPDEAPLPFQGDPRFRILDVPWQESRGACWARSQIMGLWQGEDFFLQLDSHHRFASDWDAKLLYHAERSGSAKPLLTTYATPFTPGEPDILQAEPMQMNFDRFTEEAIVLFRPGAIPNWQRLDRPVRARFISAHFLFTIGNFVNEVPYDPDLYFIGEEITLAVRAYTHGYDLFHPPEIIVWHEYTREGRAKHWDDHVPERGVEQAWHERDSASKQKVARFLAEPYVGPFGCGTVRSFEDYERYAGLSFRHLQAQDYTRRGDEPPNPPAPADWAEQIRTYRIQIKLDRAALEAPARDDPAFWYVGFHDPAREEIFRRDADEQELAQLLAAPTGQIVIDREFSSDRQAATWTVWPMSRSRGWMQKIEGFVDAGSLLPPPPVAALVAARQEPAGPVEPALAPVAALPVEGALAVPEQIRTYRIQIKLDRAALEAPARDDPAFWYVGFHDAAREEIYRRDANEQELAQLLAVPTGQIVIDREFSSDRQAATWTVWPMSRSRGWMQKIEGFVDAGSLLPPPPAALHDIAREQVARPIEPVLAPAAALPAVAREETTMPVEPALAPLTLVTALLDIGREQLDGPFARSFEDDDLRNFRRLLPVDLPMVIYIDPRYADAVWQIRSAHNTRVILLRPDELQAFPYFDQVQAIRVQPEWKAQAGWLPFSPQAALEYYNPLVMSKMRWLDEQVRANPFGTERFFWIDAGLCRTVGEHSLRSADLASRLIEAAASEFLCLGFPYPDGPEIHGFPREALTHAANAESVDRVVRGGFFGGSAKAIAGVAKLYDAVLRDTLNAGYMGTEESVLTILSYLSPDRFHCYMVEGNGLVGPFFDALLAGREQSMLLHAPAAPGAAHSSAAVAPNNAQSVPARIAEEDTEVARVGASTFLGLSMMQNRNAPFALDALLRHLESTGVRVARIIEVGTGFGGLSVLFQIYCLGREISFVSFDSWGGPAKSELFKRLRIDCRVGELGHEFVTAAIAAEVQREGVTLLLCDGADKVREVNTFSDYLKPGDLILAHDYAPSQQVFEQQINGKLWSWCEITDDRVRPAIERNGLEPVLPDVMLSAVWGCWAKRGDKVRPASMQPPVESIAVYVLTFNAPDQLELWFKSIEEAAPELLRGPEKVLVNNSTDLSTSARYDELCEKYGFTQHHFDNIGINRGRFWCAEHFENESTCDAMIYFEDDMLLHVESGVCRSGFQTQVPDLIELAKAIVRHENLDFLKFSFTELFGDHTQNWAYFNIGEQERAEDFPDGPRLRVEAVKSYRGLSYLVGDVFYSNWPMLITRKGNRALFLEGDQPVLYEQFMMARAHRLLRDGRLRAGVLLASPINHNRIIYYPAAERKEC